ncbi:MAG: hypothetical protein KAG20_05295 [Cocleimonas sp.]|nr:hypothetical protein [Cocleimonas sp.]
MIFSKKIILVSCLLGAVSAYADTSNDSTQNIQNAQRQQQNARNTFLAINKPDQYAWKLFVALNRPGNPSNCKADRSKKLGDPGLTRWQMWRSRTETFLDHAAKPKSWKKACQDGYSPALPTGDASNLENEEVRLNKKTYNFIRKNKLYSLDEQERLAAQGIKDLDFPLGSREVKAHWVKITENDKPRYHWREVDRANETVIYGLSALHISSKDQPTWFWSTFEHADNESRWPTTHPSAFRGWVVPSVDSVACPPSNLACNQIPQDFGLEGTKWENYRLRGTQIDWVDNRGNPTILTNSQIEGFLDQKSMSCMTCHALAAKGETGGPVPLPPETTQVNAEGRPIGFVGPVPPELFNNAGQNLIGLDYVWTLRHAKREAN